MPIIWKKDKLNLFLPENSFFPPKNGMHFYVFHSDIKDYFWKIKDVKELIKCANLSLGVARMVVRNEFFGDIWANIQLRSNTPFNAGVNIFGRNPFSDIWGKPIPYSKRIFKTKYDLKYLKKLKHVCSKNLNNWAAKFLDIIPFSEESRIFLNGSKEFLEAENIFIYNRPPEKRKDVIWVNDKFILTIPQRPHLTGFHFQIFPRLKYFEEKGMLFRSPWQLEKDTNPACNKLQIQSFLEMVAILLGVIKILNKNKITLFNPEIHFSGNWNKDLFLKEKGGKIDLKRLKNPAFFSKEKKELFGWREKRVAICRARASLRHPFKKKTCAASFQA